MSTPVADRLPGPVAWLVRARRPSPRARAWLLVAAAVVFVAGGVASFAGLDVALAEISLVPLVLVAVVLVPTTILGNAAELRVMASATAVDDAGSAALGWVDAIRVVVVATAANVLPIPGAALVRIQALRAAGAGGSAATVINIAGAGLWVGAALVVAGVAASPLPGAPAGALLPTGAGLALVAVGLAGIVVAGGLTARIVTAPRRTLAGLLAVELAVIVLHGARLLAVFAALDVALNLREALVIGVSAPLAAAAGFFPSGLGLAEAISAALATLVGLTAAAGFAATALNRVIGLAVTAPIALWLGAGSLRSGDGPSRGR